MGGVAYPDCWAGTDVVRDSVKFAQKGVQQFDVERARLPVRQSKGENAVVQRTIDHLRCLWTKGPTNSESA